MAMVKTLIEIDEDALATAADVLGTKTKQDTVNAALREVGQRRERLRALARLGELADQGDFDDFLSNKATYRKRVRRTGGDRRLAPLSRGVTTRR